LVLRSDRTVWSFGADDNGQLGRPDEPGVSEVQPKPVMTGASAMAGAHRHSLVLKSDGTLWSFGDNFYGQLGTTTNVGVDVNPVPAFVMSGVAQPPITQPPTTEPPITGILIDAPADVHMTANRCALGQC
jgi:alpha-tubulin suppressor-like RCC1 family protein